MDLSDQDKAERRSKRIQEKSDVTAQISDTTRFVAFGLLLAFYSIHAADPDNFGGSLQKHNVLLLIMGLSAALAVLCDYLQYFFGLKSVENALRRETLDYDDASFSYRARKFMFSAKQWFVIAGAVILVLMVALTLNIQSAQLTPAT